MTRIFLSGLALAALTACGSSGKIATACMASGRGGATPAVCNCVQGVAESTLSANERSRAIKFFKDPDAAQETRARDDAASEAFWRRYRAFATAAEQRCG